MTQYLHREVWGDGGGHLQGPKTSLINCHHLQLVSQQGWSGATVLPLQACLPPLPGPCHPPSHQAEPFIPIHNLHQVPCSVLCARTLLWGTIHSEQAKPCRWPSGRI